MTNLPSQNSPQEQADQFSKLVHALENPQSAPEEIRAQISATPEIQGLTQTVEQIRGIPPLSIPDKAALKAHLLAQYRTTYAVPEKRGRSKHFPRTLRLAAAVCFVLAAVFGGSVGFVNAAATSLPGDPLYNVKRATEALEVVFASDNQRPELLYAHAQTRLSEIDSLLGQGHLANEGVLLDTTSAITSALLTNIDSDRQHKLAAQAMDTFKRAAAVNSAKKQVWDRSIETVQILNDQITANPQPAISPTDTPEGSPDSLATFAPPNTATPADKATKDKTQPTKVKPQPTRRPTDVGNGKGNDKGNNTGNDNPGNPKK